MFYSCVLSNSVLLRECSAVNFLRGMREFNKYCTHFNWTEINGVYQEGTFSKFLNFQFSYFNLNTCRSSQSSNLSV